MGFLIRYKKISVQIHKSTPLLCIFSLKLQLTKDSLKNVVWNRCFFHHKLPCTVYQSHQHAGGLKHINTAMLRSRGVSREARSCTVYFSVCRKILGSNVFYDVHYYVM